MHLGLAELEIIPTDKAILRVGNVEYILQIRGAPGSPRRTGSRRPPSLSVDTCSCYCQQHKFLFLSLFVRFAFFQSTLAIFVVVVVCFDLPFCRLPFQSTLAAAIASNTSFSFSLLLQATEFSFCCCCLFKFAFSCLPCQSSTFAATIAGNTIFLLLLFV